MIIGLTIYVLATTQKCTIFKGRLYSNTVTVMLFFSDIKQYFYVMQAVVFINCLGVKCLLHAKTNEHCTYATAGPQVLLPTYK